MARAEGVCDLACVFKSFSIATQFAGLRGSLSHVCLRVKRAASQPSKAFYRRAIMIAAELARLANDAVAGNDDGYWILAPALLTARRCARIPCAWRCLYTKPPLRRDLQQMLPYFDLKVVPLKPDAATTASADVQAKTRLTAAQYERPPCSAGLFSSGP